MTKAYLGDAVYVMWDGWGFVLTTEDGMRETNRIVLEPEVYTALVAYVERLKKEAQTKRRESTGALHGDQ